MPFSIRGGRFSAARKQRRSAGVFWRLVNVWRGLTFWTGPK